MSKLLAFTSLLTAVGFSSLSAGATDSWNLFITHENDLFMNTDRDYTAGQQVALLAPLREGGLTDQHRWGFNLGQQIYTPKDYVPYGPILNDRPFAGYLYGSVEYHAITPAASPEGWARLHSFELQIGVVGESAMGEDSQDYIHDLRSFYKFNGWDNQLRDEPAGVVAYELTGRKVLWHGDDYQADLLPFAAVRAGNVALNASAGTMLRWGRNLPDNFGRRTIRAGAPQELDYRQSGSFHKADRWSWYVFGGAEGRLVGHDIFLDGNSYKASQSIGRENVVGEFMAGAVVECPCGWSLSFTGVFRTKEHDGQANHAFAALGLGCPL